jgi:methylamine dehydrogenase heavy chain
MSIRLAWLLVLPWAALAEVPVDHIPNSLSLPSAFPDSWVFVYATPQMDNGILGAYSIIDVAADTKEYKGLFQGAFWPSLIAPAAGSELYVAESFLERVSHGKRTDVLTINDKSHLSPVAEIPLSAGKRNLLSGSLMDVTHDGKFILVLNFTPASSVTVVDLRKRQRVNEVPIPGCTSIHPTGARGFSSLCQDGSLATFRLGDRGQVLHESHSPSFNDIDHDVLYMNPATTDGVTYFVTERANVRPVEMGEGEVKIQPAWPLMTPEEAEDGWRTSDGRLLASDGDGRLYVRVYRETGYDKQRKDNTEVWVFDPPSHRRVNRIPLKNGGSSIDVTREKKPHLVVVAASDPSVGESLDVYDALTGRFVRTIGGWWQGTSLSLVQATR